MFKSEPYEFFFSFLHELIGPSASAKVPADKLSRSEWAVYEAQPMQYSHEYSIIPTAMEKIGRKAE
jgi:hypothetical protein